MPTLAELNQVLGTELKGDGGIAITGVASVEGGGPGDIAPVDSEKFLRAAAASKAQAFIVATSIASHFDGPCLVSDYPLADMNRIIGILGMAPERPAPGVHPAAVVEPGAEIGADTHVGPCCVVHAGARIGDRCILQAGVVIEGDVVMGDDCMVEPGAVLHDGCRIGDRVRIGAHAVLSRQGFGYAAGPEGPVLLHHVGTVVLEDDVEVGAATMVDRARFDETRIGRFSKLDNLIHLGHNSMVGARTFMAAQTGLAGNARIGDDCEVGGQVGIANHAGVGSRCRVGAKSGIFGMFPDDMTVYGFPAHERGEWLRQQAAVRRLVKPD